MKLRKLITYNNKLEKYFSIRYNTKDPVNLVEVSTLYNNTNVKINNVILNGITLKCPSPTVSVEIIGKDKASIFIYDRYEQYYTQIEINADQLPINLDFEYNNKTKSGTLKVDINYE